MNETEKISLAGCAIVKDNKILLLKRRKTGWYELPGGKLENWETEEAAAIREIKEELWLRIKIIVKIWCTSFTENNRDFSYTWFRAEIVGDEEPKVKEEEKFEAIEYVEISKLREYLLSPNMKNFVDELESGRINLS